MLYINIYIYTLYIILKLGINYELISWVYIITINKYFIFINFKALYLIFIALMLLVFILLIYSFKKKVYNKYKVALLQIFLVLNFLSIFLLFLIDQFLVFIIFFEIMVTCLMFIIFNFLFNNRIFIALYYLLVFSFLSGVASIGLLLYLQLNTGQHFYILHTFNSFLHSFENVVSWLFLFFIFGVKYPVFPFTTWLFNVHVEVSTELSIFLASIVLKAGFIGVYKFLFLEMATTTYIYLSLLLLVVSLGLLSCIFQMLLLLDFKKIIAFWSILHLNISIITIWYNNATCTFIYIFSNLGHIISSGSFFLFLGYIYESFNTKILFYLNGLYGSNIVSFLSIFLFLNNIEFPFFMLFYIETITCTIFYHIATVYILILLFIIMILFLSNILLLLLISAFTIRWGNNNIKHDLNSVDLLVFNVLTALTLILFWQVDLLL